MKDINEKRTKCEVWTRCVGYLRPVSQFNDAKVSEYLDRKPYQIKLDKKNKVC
jgi:anaerobic ribonucleoside-triphosphate reductase